jgi:quercetin dioxygenase-like cupin family protein
MTMNRKTVTWLLAGLFLAGGLGGIALKELWATPPSAGFTPTHIVGPSDFGSINTWAETDDWEAEIRVNGRSDVYMTHFKLAPGAHGGWHSHPGPSFIAVKSGTATVYDDCVDPTIPWDYPAGSGFVEDAYCVHIVVNEGDTDLEFVVLQIVPRGAPRRIDEPDPRD